MRDVRNQWREVDPCCGARGSAPMMPERKEKAQQRLRQIEEKQASAAAATTPPASAAGAQAEPTGRSGARENTSYRETADREAAARASQQREHQPKPTAEQALWRRNRQANSPARSCRAVGGWRRAAPGPPAKRDRRNWIQPRHKPGTLPTPPERRWEKFDRLDRLLGVAQARQLLAFR